MRLQQLRLAWPVWGEVRGWGRPEWRQCLWSDAQVVPHRGHQGQFGRFCSGKDVSLSLNICLFTQILTSPLTIGVISATIPPSSNPGRAPSRLPSPKNPAATRNSPPHHIRPLVQTLLIKLWKRPWLTWATQAVDATCPSYSVSSREPTPAGERSGE